MEADPITNVKAVDVTGYVSNIPYDLPPSTKPFVVEKKTQSFQSDRTSYNLGSGGGIIEVTIPASELSLEPRNSYFVFKLTSANDAARLRGSVMRIFQRLEIETYNNSRELERIDLVGHVENMLHDTTVSNYTKKRSGQLEGCYDGMLDGPDRLPYHTLDNTDAAHLTTSLLTFQDPYETDEAKAAMAVATPRHYSIHFHSSGILSSARYLHLKPLGGIKIKLTLQNAAIAGMVGSHDFTVSDFRFVGSMVRFSDSVNAAITQAAISGAMELSYDTWYVNRTASYNQNSDITVEINKAVSNAIMAVACRRSAARNSDPAKDSFVAESYRFRGYEFQLGGSSYPGMKCNNPAWALSELHKSFGYLNNIHATSVTYTEFIRDLVLAGATAVDVETASVPFQGCRAPKHYVAADFESDSSSFSTGVSTKQGNVLRLIYDADFTLRPSAFGIFLFYTKVVRVTSLGSVLVMD